MRGAADPASTSLSLSLSFCLLSLSLSLSPVCVILSLVSLSLCLDSCKLAAGMGDRLLARFLAANRVRPSAVGRRVGECKVHCSDSSASALVSLTSLHAREGVCVCVCVCVRASLHAHILRLPTCPCLSNPLCLSLCVCMRRPTKSSSGCSSPGSSGHTITSASSAAFCLLW